MKYRIYASLIVMFITIIWINTFEISNFFFGTKNFKNDIDPFSAISAIYSGLALVGVIVAIFYQQNELILQRKELENTRLVFEIERFETTFFNLLANHRQIVSQIKHDFKETINIRDKNKWKDITINSTILTGIDFFKKIYDDLHKSYQMSIELERADGLSYVHSKREYSYLSNRYSDLSAYYVKSTIARRRDQFEGSKLQLEIIAVTTTPIYKEYKDIFQYYFGNLTQALVLLEEISSKLNINDSVNRKTTIKKYSNILKSQLTTYEITLIFYYLFFNKTYNPIFEKTSLLDDIDIDNLLSKDHLQLFKLEINSVNVD